MKEEQEKEIGKSKAIEKKRKGRRLPKIKDKQDNRCENINKEVEDLRWEGRSKVRGRGKKASHRIVLQVYLHLW